MDNFVLFLYNMCYRILFFIYNFAPKLIKVLSQIQYKSP